MRCPWASDALLAAYHDEEWGVPVHDDRRHFEMLTLEGAQAGLSWRTVLARRDGYRQAFASFEPAGVASFTPSLLEALLADPGVIRHRGKLESVVTNARAFVAVQEAEGGFDAYVWRFVDGRPVSVTPSRPPPNSPPPRRSQRPSAATFAAGASPSSGRRSATRTCRPPGW